MPNTTDLLASTVMNFSAVLMNDAAKSVYTYVAQLPFLNMAMKELQEFFELNNIPVTDETSAEITIPANTGEFGFAPDPVVPNTPYLPDNLIEPKVLWEREYNVNPYIPMTRLESLPRWQEGTEINQFIWYVWATQKIKVMPCNQINQIKMDYIRNLFALLTEVDGSENIPIINAATFLQYRTAGLCAEFMAENKTRADELNGFAGLGMDRVIGIGTKGRQAISVRHRPFRSSYKRRSYQ